MFLKSKLEKYQPLHPDTSDLTRCITDTSERLELDPKQATIVGSGALILYGIMPPDYFDPLTHQRSIRPGDVDHIVTASLFHTINQNEMTPNGVPAYYDTKNMGRLQHIIRAKPNHLDAHLLPADILTRFNPALHTLNEYDQRFAHYHSRHDKIIPGTNQLHVLSLDKIASELRMRAGSDPKAKDDLQAIVDFVKRQG